MIKFIRNLFKCRKQQCKKLVNNFNIHEGKEKCNNKIVTTPRPDVMPCPQSVKYKIK
jgi:hypothetical protein